MKRYNTPCFADLELEVPYWERESLGTCKERLDSQDTCYTLLSNFLVQTTQSNT